MMVLLARANKSPENCRKNNNKKAFLPQPVLPNNLPSCCNPPPIEMEESTDSLNGSTPSTTTTASTTATTTAIWKTVGGTTTLSDEEIEALLRLEAGLDVNAVPSTPKRSDYISWDDYFMAIAFLSAKRSKDPVTPTGACLVDTANRVIGIGYNGFPRGCSDNVLPWRNVRTDDDDDDNDETVVREWLHSPNPFVCHAEVNAILNKCSDDTVGARLYVPDFPSNECAKVIVQSRIRQVIYLNDPHHDDDCYRASRILLHMGGVETTRYTPTVDSIQLNLDSESNNHNDNNNNITTEEQADETISPEALEHRDLLMREAGWDPTVRPVTKRRDYLSWDDYFMAMAFLTAKRSKDPNTQVGACLVDPNKRIVGLGYNGFPRGCSDDCLPWGRTSSQQLHTKYPYVCHAEVNAILNKGSASVHNATLYVALFPCNECAKVIIQSGIQEVVYLNDTYHDTDMCRASRIMFGMAGVKLRQLTPQTTRVHIDFHNAQEKETL